MHVHRLLAALWLAASLSTLSLASEAALAAEPAGQADAEHAGEVAGGEHHGLPPGAVPLYNLGGFQVTNSMVVTWIVALGLILFARSATRRMQEVPEGSQNLLEWLVEVLYELLAGIIGAQLVRKTFWFFATLFIFILSTNWFGLLPGFGTIGWGVQGEHGFRVTEPLLRGGNADLNMTSAMACMFAVLWLIWALQANGLKGFILHLFGPKGDSTGFLKVLLIVVFVLVGFLEVISIGFRPISLSFRLFGNVFAGENMLEAMMVIHPYLGAVLPIPFYFLELLVGLVQALVFMLLTAVFTMMICTHEEGPGEAHH